MIRDILELFISRREFFAQLSIEHLKISMFSILLAALIGLILGIFISEYEKTSGTVLGIVNFIYTIPSISLLGFLIPFSGIGNKTAIIALTIYALLPMVRNTHTGIKNIDPAVLEAAKGMGSTNFQILYKIKLPLALPVIMSGLRNMVTMTIALAGIASFIGAGGLGVAIYRGITTNNSAMTITGSLLIAILAVAMDFILGFIERMVNRSRGIIQKNMIIAGIIITVGIIGAFFVGSAGKDTIKIATKPMTEQYILGEMLKAMIEEETGLNVEVTQGVGGGTAHIWPAIEKGDFDLYPEYTGTGWNMVLKQEDLYTESMFEDLKKAYQEDYQMEWVGMYGFNNTYGLAIRKELAEEYDIKTYSDLASISDQLTFGAEYDFFEREDGFQALSEAYGYNFPNTVDMDLGLKYQAINQGKIDVMNIFTTDGQISASDIVVLEDDKNFYPSYRCGNVIRGDVLDAHPAIRDVLMKLENSIDDTDMARLNYLIESEGMEPKDAARDFLREKGLLK